MPTSDHLTAAEIVQLVTEEEEEEEENADEEAEEDDGPAVVKCVLVHSALKAADELQSYLDIHGDDCHHQSLLHIKCLITEKLIAAPKQSKIADFFQK